METVELASVSIESLNNVNNGSAKEPHDEQADVDAVEWHRRITS